MVLVADLSRGELCDLAVIQYSEVEEVLIKIKETETEFKMNKEGYVIRKGDENLKDILLKFIGEVKSIVVVQGTSPNIPALEILETKVETLLK